MGRPGADRAGHRGVQVARDDPGAEAEAARRLGEEHGEVAARAPATVERGDRRLGALFVPALVEDRVGDAGAEVLEQRQRVGGGPADEAARPGAQPPVGVGILQHRERPEVGPFVVGIAEGIDDGGSRDVEDRPGDRVELDPSDAVDRYRVAHGLEGRGRHRIAPDVMRPADACLGRHRQLEPGQPQLAALAGTQHQPVRAEADRAAVAVCRLVMDA